MKEPGQAVPINIHQPPAFVHKILQLSGILLYYEEFTEGGDGARMPSPVPKVSLLGSVLGESTGLPKPPRLPLLCGQSIGSVPDLLQL